MHILHNTSLTLGAMVWATSWGVMDTKYNFSLDQNIRLIFTSQKFSASSSSHCAVENRQCIVFASNCFYDLFLAKDSLCSATGVDLLHSYNASFFTS